MKKILTLNCEIVEQLKPKDSRWNKPAELTISCLGLQWQEKAAKVSYCWIPGEDVLYWDGIIDELNSDEVQRILNAADLVVTFNGERFDFPLMEAAGFDMGHAKEVSYDIVVAFVKAAGHWISLEALVKSPVGRGKTGRRSLASQLWKGATVLRKLAGYGVDIGEIIGEDWQESDLVQGALSLYQAVINYCLDDVVLTREVFD